MTQVAVDRWELHPGDPLYPRQLAETPEAPSTLYVLGDPTRLVPGLGVVGARKATPYGRWAAQRFAGWAGAAGVTIVSGAAIGCDRVAQQAAVDAGGPSVAVLGCGADVDYPRSSKTLLERLRAHGAVVLLRRNRIIAGLSKAVLIVEAALPSGTFSTADFALEADRQVLVVPGSIRAPESRGTNRLLRQGATPVTDVSELADELTALDLIPVRGRLPAGDTGGDSSADGLGDSLVHCDAAIARALVADPMRPDDVAWVFGMDIREVMVALARFESAGVIARYPDGRYGSR
jgi:DNA processing protein